MSDNAVYELLKLNDRVEFQQLYKELKEDEMACESCFTGCKNYFLFIKYQFIQELAKTSEITMQIFRQEMGVFGTCIDLKYNLLGNENILADVTYPVEFIESVPICNYYTVFWCNPGIWCGKPPVVIVDVNIDNQSYKLKGHIQKMIFENSDRICYRIKLTNCNCFLEKVLEAENYSAKLTIIPDQLVDNYGKLRGNKSYADKFTI